MFAPGEPVRLLVSVLAFPQKTFGPNIGEPAYRFLSPAEPLVYRWRRGESPGSCAVEDAAGGLWHVPEAFLAPRSAA